MKTILITGSAGGIGDGMVKYFRNNDWFVIGVDKIKHNTIKNTNLFFNYDISDIRQIEKLKIDLDKKNIKHIDILVNNAAIQIKKKIFDIEYNDWKICMDTNVIAPFFMVQKLIDKLDDSAVFNISSIHANLSKKDFLLYATTKGALKTLTQNMSLEFTNTRVNCILPAAIDTPMLKYGLSSEEYDKLKNYHPVLDIGYPEDVAKLIFTLSQNSKFLTGSMIEFDGGISKLLHDPGV